MVRGSLKAFRKPLPIAELSLSGLIGTVYRYQQSDGTERWLEWAEDVDVQPGPIANDISKRVYFTGTDLPRVFDDTQVAVGPRDPFPKSNFRMGVPAPATALTAALGAGGSGSARDVRFVWTYVRRWASGAEDESGPSPASNIVNALQGQEIDLTGFTSPSVTDAGITHIWIYRLNTGTAGAEYQFVDEIPVATTTYQDTKPDSDLSEVLDTEEWLTPPDDLKGLISIPNGCFVGFSGKQVCFSVPYQVHAYPTRFRYAVQFEIVGLGYIGNMVIALTNERAFYLDGSDPGFVGHGKAATPYPCLSKRGIVNTKRGVLYPTHEGVAIVLPGGDTGLFTKDIVSSEEWEGFFPSTIFAVTHRGRYFAIFDSST
jgi:hypothetical protein